MNRILKSQKRLKKCKTNRFAAWLLAVLMLFSALPTGSITVHAETETTDVAKIGETTYTSLEDAIEAAVSGNTGNTIQLIDDTETTVISLSNGITLDLNGYTLNASGIFTLEGTNVIDSSSGKNGILKVPGTQFVLSSSNSQMPVYDATKGGYAFAEIVHQEHVIDNAEADTYEFIFKPYFGATINKLLKDGGDTAEVDFGIRLKWGTIVRDLPYKDDIVKQVYTENSGLAFYVKLIGVNDFEGLTITPFIKSEEGTVCLGTEYPATLVTGDDTDGGNTDEEVLSGYYFTADREDWSFGGTWEGSAANSWENGALKRSAKAADATLWSPALNVDATKADHVLLRVKVDGATKGSTVNVAVQVESEWKYYSVQLTEDILATDSYYEVKLDLTEVNSGTISKIGITQWYDETTGAETTQTFYMDSCEIWSTADSE